MAEPGPQDVIDFWIDAGPEKWWKKNPDFDAEIEQRFGETHRRAAAGELDEWGTTPDGALALILVLDQFSRNLFRNSPRAFAQDEQCVSIVLAQMETGADREMHPDVMHFCYLPLMHSEQLEHQQMCIAEMERLENTPSLRAAIQHRDIIADFGRFPHRNALLGRKTTDSEQAFLDGGGFSG
ncbi:MAG: DUF924 family protein [Rhizobiaceae bacterium]